MSASVGESIAALLVEEGTWASKPDGIERMSGKLRVLLQAMRDDPEALKPVAVRDELCKAIVKLGKEPLSPPMRRQLSLCTDALGDAEPRAIMPLVDALHAALSSGALSTSASTSSSSSPASPASRAQLTLLSCLKQVWARHGKHCLSRLHETLASTRSHWRPGYPADLRVAAAQCCLAAIATPGSLRGIPIAQHLALVKPLSNDQVPALRLCGIKLAVAMVREDRSMAADLVPTLVKALDAPDTINASAELGSLLAMLASPGGAPTVLQAKTSVKDAFRTRKTLVSGCEGVHGLVASIFCKEKCSDNLRMNLARAYASMLSEIRLWKLEGDFVAEFVPRILNLAVAMSKYPSRERARLKHACVCHILRVGIGKRLTEAGLEILVRVTVAEINARKGALNMHIAVACALQELTNTLVDLGGGFQPTDEIKDLILSLLHSPWLPLRLSAGTTLRSFAFSSPDKLTAVLRHCLAEIHAQVNMIPEQSSPQGMQGVSLCIASAMMSAPAGTLGLPVGILDECMSVANMLVKDAWTAKYSAKVDDVSVGMRGSRMGGGWAIVCASIRMGPEWVEGYIPMLMQLWADALAGPPSGVATGNKMSERDLQCWVEAVCGAMAAIEVFVTDCGVLLNRQDVASSIAACLQRIFCCDLVVKGHKLPSAGDTHTDCVARNLIRSDLVKLRLFKLLCALPDRHLPRSLHSNVLKRTFQVFGRSSDRRGVATSLDRDYLNSTDDILQPLDRGQEADSGLLEAYAADTTKGGDVTAQQLDECAVDSWSTGIREVLLPARHLRVQTVDQGVRVFVRVFPGADAKDQASLLSAVADKIITIEDAEQRKNSMINACLALVESLKKLAEARISIPAGDEWLGKADQVFQQALADSSLTLRRIAAEGIGLLARLSSDDYLHKLMVLLTSPVVKPASAKAKEGEADRADPRAACALAIGCVYRYAGGMRCNQIVDVSLTLQKLFGWSTAGGMVGAWALHGLCLTLECSSAICDKHAKQAVALVSSLYHRTDPLSPYSSERPPLLVSLARLCLAAITSLGPDLHSLPTESAAIHQVLAVMQDGASHPSGMTCAQSSRTAASLIQQLIVFDKGDGSSLMPCIAPLLEASQAQVRLTALKCLRAVSDRIGRAESARIPTGYERLVFSIMDKDEDAGVSEEAMSLALHLASRCSQDDLVSWFKLCKEVCTGRHVGSLFPQAQHQHQQHQQQQQQKQLQMQRHGNRQAEGTSKQAGEGRGDSGGKDGEQDGGRRGGGEEEGGREEEREEHEDDDDDDDEAMPRPDTDEGPVHVPRWRTKKCALSCFIRVAICADGAPHHFDLALARSSSIGEANCLVTYLAQMVSLAFNAVTSRPVPLRLTGVQLLEELVKRYGPQPDPDCEGALLLEQSEAQIISGLRTALQQEQHPTVAVAACNVCWEFLSFARPAGHDIECESGERMVQLLIDLVQKSLSTARGCYSDLAYASVQVTCLRTLAMIYSRGAKPAERSQQIDGPERSQQIDGPERSQQIDGPERSQQIDGPERQANERAPDILMSSVCKRMPLELLSRLWTAGLKEHLRASMGLSSTQMRLSDEEESICAGVFAPRMAPLLATCIIPFTEAAALAAPHVRCDDDVDDGHVRDAREARDAGVYSVLMWRLSMAKEPGLEAEGCHAALTLATSLMAANACPVSRSLLQLASHHACLLTASASLKLSEAGLKLIPWLLKHLGEDPLSADLVAVVLTRIMALFQPRGGGCWRLMPSQTLRSADLAAASHALRALGQAAAWLVERGGASGRRSLCSIGYVAGSCLWIDEGGISDAAVECLSHMDAATLQGGQASFEWGAWLGKRLCSGLTGESDVGVSTAWQEGLITCIGMSAPLAGVPTGGGGGSREDAHVYWRALAAGNGGEEGALRVVRVWAQTCISSQLAHDSPRRVMVGGMLSVAAPVAASILDRQGSSGSAEAVRFLILCHAVAPQGHKSSVLAASLPLLVKAMSGSDGGGEGGELAAKGCTAIASGDTAAFREGMARLTVDDRAVLQAGMRRVVMGK